MPEWLENIGLLMASYLPNLLVALLILVIGWLVAYLISRLVGNLLRRTSLDDRIANMLKGGQPERMPVERWISTAVFWILMLFVIIAFLNQLNLGVVSGPLNGFLQQIIAFLPGLFGAVILLLLAFVIATFLRMLIVRLVSASGLAKRVSENAEVGDARDRVTIGETIGNVVYWLVFLLFLPAVLDALNLQGILAPVQAMVDDILGVLPNILGAALVLVIGWLAARIIRQIVTNLLAGLGIDRFTERTTTGMAQTDVPPTAGGMRLSSLIGTIVFVLIMIPVVIGALNVLDIPAISQPAANMLNNLLLAIPNIFAALLLLGIAFFVARMVGTFVAGILSNLGFDRLFQWLGLSRFTGIQRQVSGAVHYTAPEPTEGAAPTEVRPGRTTPSEVVGVLVTVAIMLFAAMEAANLLGFEALALLIGEFIFAAGNILFGLIIFGLGLYLANLVYNLVRSTSIQQSDLLAVAARVAVIVFAAALALRQMGIAASIVNLAFGLLLGAIAVAVAIAFGLGGRDTAARVLENWRKNINEGQVRPIPTTGGTPGMGGASRESGGMQDRDIPGIPDSGMHRGPGESPDREDDRPTPGGLPPI